MEALNNLLRQHASKRTRGNTPEPSVESPELSDEASQNGSDAPMPQTITPEFIEQLVKDQFAQLKDEMYAKYDTELSQIKTAAAEALKKAEADNQVLSQRVTALEHQQPTVADMDQRLERLDRSNRASKVVLSGRLDCGPGVSRALDGPGAAASARAAISAIDPQLAGSIANTSVWKGTGKVEVTLKTPADAQKVLQNKRFMSGVRADNSLTRQQLQQRSNLKHVVDRLHQLKYQTQWRQATLYYKTGPGQIPMRWEGTYPGTNPAPSASQNAAAAEMSRSSVPPADATHPPNATRRQHTGRHPVHTGRTQAPHSQSTRVHMQNSPQRTYAQAAGTAPSVPAQPAPPTSHCNTTLPAAATNAASSAGNTAATPMQTDVPGPPGLSTTAAPNHTGQQAT